MKIKTEFLNLSWQPVNPQLIGIRLLAAWSLKTLSFSISNELNVLTELGRWRGIFFSFPSQKFSLSHYFTPKRAFFHYFNRKISVTHRHHSTTAIIFLINLAWAYIFQRPILRGLFLEGLIYGGKFAFQNRLGYRFCFVLLCIRGQFSKYKPPGGLYLEGRFNGEFFASLKTAGY